jgi:hypothetical protein
MSGPTSLTFKALLPARASLTPLQKSAEITTCLSRPSMGSSTKGNCKAWKNSRKKAKKKAPAETNKKIQIIPKLGENRLITKTTLLELRL